MSANDDIQPLNLAYAQQQQDAQRPVDVLVPPPAHVQSRFRLDLIKPTGSD